MSTHCALWLAAPDLQLPLSMLLVFGSAKLLAELLERLNQPAIVGEILAGVLLGPSVLGWVAPNEFLSALANLGAMFLLFGVGLEVKSRELLRVGGTATLVATLGVVAPFFLGWGILLLWGASQIESIFVGATMVATSVGITARVLSSHGLLQERSSKIILAAAVIDDVQGLLVLALVSSFAKGKVAVLELTLTAALAIGFTVVVAVWGARTMGKMVPRLQAGLRAQEAEFFLAMVVLFAASLLAVWVGVAAIVGAFLAGMALSESVGRRVHDMAHGVTELLVPFFLAGIGLHVNLGMFRDPSITLLTAVILVAAILSKFVGCGLGAASLGRADAIRIGLGMMPRGEVGMVAAQLGLAMGTISQNVYGVVVFMAVATTLIAPPCLNLAYRAILTARRQEDRQAQRPPGP
ncbi:MAG: cation:proton antiporter [Bryobacteraceae bacterium]